MDFIGSVTSNPVFVAVFVCLILSIANFVVGSVTAWSNGSFEAEAFDAWVRKDGGKLIPIFIYLGVGLALNAVDTTSIPALPADFVSAGIIGYGLIQAGSYIIATLDSIRESLSPNPNLKLQKIAAAEKAGDEVPSEE